MSKSDSTLVQFNFKAENGMLLNVYADNEGDLESGLDLIEAYYDRAQAIQSKLGNGAVRGYAQKVAVQEVSPVRAANTVAKTSTRRRSIVEQEVIEAPECEHGEMRLIKPRTGGKRFSPFYACSLDRDDPDRCDPVNV